MLATLWNGPGGTGFVFALLVLISLGFLLRFVLPALILLRQLGRAVGQLEKLAAGGQPADPEVIARQVMVTPRLAHLWREYAQTLHGISPATAARCQAQLHTLTGAGFKLQRHLGGPFAQAHDDRDAARDRRFEFERDARLLRQFGEFEGWSGSGGNADRSPRCSFFGFFSWPPLMVTKLGQKPLTQL